MVKKASIICASLLLSSLLHAQPMSSDVRLGGGVAAPTQTLNIPFTKLLKGINYKVTCDVAAPADPDAVVVRVYVYGEFFANEIRLNGINKGTGEAQIKLPPFSMSQLEVFNVVSNNNNDGLAIQNADQDHEVRIDNCTAVATG